MAAKAKVLLRSIVPNRSFKMAWKGLQSVMSFSQPIVLIEGVDNFFIYAYIAECVAFTKCYNRVFFGGGNVFSTSLKRPADPGKTEKGKLIV